MFHKVGSASPCPAGEDGPDRETALALFQPETLLLRWHRERFRAFCKHPSQAPLRHLKMSSEMVGLLEEMAVTNRLWGAQRFGGELLKRGIGVRKPMLQKEMRHMRPKRVRLLMDL